MRLLTWNINGVRTLPQYHPWNGLKTFDDILTHLGADIICFQEMKSGRKLLTQEVAVPPSFDSFFSFPIKKTGYSGVATYSRSTTAVPLKAEEGLAGVLQPKLLPEERISDYINYPPRYIDNDLDEGQEDQLDYKTLDGEGRAIVVDFGLFVLINTYCPNDGTGTEEREAFKMQYHRLLETRVKALIEQEKREVIVVGDLNACAAVIDHCEGDLMVKKGLAMGLEGEEGFWGKDYRRWIRDWLQNEDGSGGPMVDIVRRFWPNRQGMYTCWNTKISARESNYGTRIDFILVTPGLVPWIKAADIQPHVKGSDHCPVYVDFHDSIIEPTTGETIPLTDVLSSPKNDGMAHVLPRIAAKFWEEFSGKQTLLQQFFKGPGRKLQNDPHHSSLPRMPSPATLSNYSDEELVVAASQNSGPPSSPSKEFSTPLPPPPHSQGSSDSLSLFPSRSGKRKLTAGHPTQTKRKKNGASADTNSTESKSNSQATLASFFQRSRSTCTPPKGKGKALELLGDIDTEDEDYKLALQLSQEHDDSYHRPHSSQGSLTENSQKSKQAWNTLLAPVQAPRCTGHYEPAKEFTVNKPGPNKGKKFFICSRPVGPGYDKGRSERLREHVDPQYRCDFFKWSSDVKKEMMKNPNASP